MSVKIAGLMTLKIDYDLVVNVHGALPEAVRFTPMSDRTTRMTSASSSSSYRT